MTEISGEALDIAERINARVDSHPLDVEGTEALLMCAYDSMDDFRKSLDLTNEDQLLKLCSVYTGLSRFSELLNDIALGIQNGSIEVPLYD